MEVRIRRKYRSSTPPIHARRGKQQEKEKEMEKQMTRITECEVTDCAYNKHKSCHTLAITIGGPEICPQCDTYVTSDQAAGILDMKAGVGACKVSTCTFNESLECS